MRLDSDAAMREKLDLKFDHGDSDRDSSFD